MSDKKQNPVVLAAWNNRCKLYAEGAKLRAEGNKLYAEGAKLRAEGDKLYAEGDKLRAEGAKLYAEGDKLHAEGAKLYAEGNKLYAEGDKLCAEGDKLCAEGNIHFFGAVVEECGNVEVKWMKEDAIVCGAMYKAKEQDPCEGKVVEIEGKKYKLTAV